MGIDTTIYVRIKDGHKQDMDFLDNYPRRPLQVFDTPQEIAQGSNIYRISFMDRFYSPLYARGNWPSIAAYLLNLLSMDCVKSAMYTGDCTDVSTEADYDPNATLEFINEMNKFYVKHTNKPYREDGYNINLEELSPLLRNV
jgi:hypothetical protein